MLEHDGGQWQHASAKGLPFRKILFGNCSRLHRKVKEIAKAEPRFFLRSPMWRNGRRNGLKIQNLAIFSGCTTLHRSTLES